MQCLFCSSSRFQRSRLRPSDAGHLALMEYPVRCLDCRQRQFANFVTAALSVPSYKRHHLPPPGSFASTTSGFSMLPPDLARQQPPSAQQSDESPTTH